MKPIAALMLLLALTGCKEKEKVLKVTLDQPTLTETQMQNVVSAWRKLKEMCPALASKDIVHVTGVLEDETTMPGWGAMYPQFKQYQWVGDILFQAEDGTRKQTYNLMFGYGQQPAILYKETHLTDLCQWQGKVERLNDQYWIYKQ